MYCFSFICLNFLELEIFFKGNTIVSSISDWKLHSTQKTDLLVRFQIGYQIAEVSAITSSNTLFMKEFNREWIYRAKDCSQSIKFVTFNCLLDITACITNMNHKYIGNFCSFQTSPNSLRHCEINTVVYPFTICTSIT